MVRPIVVRRRLAPLDPIEQRRHKRRNLVHSGLLITGLLALLAACGWLLFGVEGMVGIVLGGGLALALGPKLSPGMVLRLYRARQLTPAQLPAVFPVLGALSERAGLSRPPRLCYVPSMMINAFAVGRPDDAAIAVTDGMLRALTLRELAGVLAHEISHIRNGDLWLMGLADLAGRLIRSLSLFGLVLAIVGLPLWLSGIASFPWLVIPVLLMAPQLTVLLQLALSRAREFDADLDAAGLTGDPGGLAAALAKLEHHQQQPWMRLLMPGYRSPEPSLLRSHPLTTERIARLQALAALPAARIDQPDAPNGLGWSPITTAPRTRLLGFWY